MGFCQVVLFIAAIPSRGQYLWRPREALGSFKVDYDQVISRTEEDEQEATPKQNRC